MDFSLTAQHEALKKEIRAFIEAELPSSDPPEPHIDPRAGTDEEFEFALEFSKKLSKRGWYTAAWPEEHGGLGFGPIESLILGEELSYHGIGAIDHDAMMIAGLLMQYGTDEQRKKFLPLIANCEIIFGEGYSEPDAGADLASLRTVARRDGDEYVIDGTKIWTGSGPRSDWMFVFVRTDTDAPKHHGISFILLDMTTPGVSVRPLHNLADHVAFGQEFFESVRVPAENLIGEENTGWRQRGAVHGVGIRTPPDNHSKMRRYLERLIDYCKEAPDGHGRLGDDVLVRQKIAKLATEVEVSRTLAWRNVSLETKKQLTVSAGESVGIFNRELNQRLARTAVEILGLYGPLLPDEPRAKLRGWFARAYLFTVASTIYGGTVDIHRYILAHRGLGLPRELSLPRS